MKDEEIEITPAMIEAGASVIYAMDLTTAREEFYAEAVYRAMCAARQSDQRE